MHLSPSTQTCGCQPDDQAAATAVLKKHKVLPRISSTCSRNVFLYTLCTVPSVSVCHEYSEFSPRCPWSGFWARWLKVSDVGRIARGWDMQDFFPPHGVQCCAAVWRMRKIKHESWRSSLYTAYTEGFFFSFFWGGKSDFSLTVM